MALTTTLLLMRTAVREAADVVAFTDRHSDTAVNHLINRGLGALLMLCRSVNPEFQPVASTTINCDGTNTTFALPATFRSLISVEYTADSAKTWLLPFEMHERASMTDPDATATRAEFYRVIGTNIELLPLPHDDHTALVWYATTATQLTATGGGDAETFDTMERLDSYVIWWAAREIALSRGDWERDAALGARLAAMADEIRILARSKDVSAPGRIVDVSYADRYGRWPYGRRFLP